MSVREYIYGLLADDPELNSYGISRNTLFGSGAVEGTPPTRFGVLRWGPAAPGAPGQRGAGKVTERDVILWLYEQQADFSVLDLAIKRWCLLMDGITGARTGSGANDGWITEAYWVSDGDDGWDDAWERHVRSSTYTIVASGV